MRKILCSEWFSPGGTAETIGIVAAESDDGWKAYMGIAAGYDKKSDEQHIADWGSKLPSKIAFAVI